jgi:hypothetical protein
VDVAKDDKGFVVLKLGFVDEKLLDFDWIVVLICFDNIFNSLVFMAFGSSLDIFEVNLFIFGILNNLVQEQENSIEVRNGLENLDNWLDSKFYDSKVIGKYCEEKDPHLAFQAYSRDFGQNDDEIIELTNKESLFKKQARYLVERQDLDLW